eukprot:361259-Chlamydomonas_euryale.AAC.2
MAWEWKGCAVANSAAPRRPDLGMEGLFCRPDGRASLRRLQVKHGVPLILSVDDDPINQMVINDLLAHEGYKVYDKKPCLVGLVCWSAGLVCWPCSGVLMVMREARGGRARACLTARLVDVREGLEGGRYR